MKENIKKSMINTLKISKYRNLRHETTFHNRKEAQAYLKPSHKDFILMNYFVWQMNRYILFNAESLGRRCVTSLRTITDAGTSIS